MSADSGDLVVQSALLPLGSSKVTFVDGKRLANTLPFCPHNSQ
jgi:hypothetical protein